MHTPVDITAEARVFRSGRGAHLFLADGSRIFNLDEELAASLMCSLSRREIPPELGDLIGFGANRYIGDETIAPPPVKCLSLNVAQACNLSCSYCYADEGRFGGKARTMPEDIARKAIDGLIADSPPASDLLVGFMGGEPFVNRKLVHWATRYAAETAAAAGHRMRFSITTNATLLTDQDAALLSAFPFAVAVSLDGDRASNDLQRQIASGRGSAYDAVVAGLSSLTMSRRRPKHLSLRCTVTPFTGSLPELLEHLLSFDVDEAGFAPVIAAPPGTPAFEATDLEQFLAEMIACGAEAKRRALAGEIWAFSNFHTAMLQLHRGAHMPYPCGAGAGYLSVGSNGGLYGCHRLVDDAGFQFGDIASGADSAARAAHLERSHVDRQEPCRSCWARYLCGGGCYHEVSRRGRIGCDYVRGWLEFCLSAYAEISQAAPAYFSNLISKPRGESHA
ncbi:radical SAM/SPASM domain-containing protein [Methylocystis sp. H62]|uniref:radical SAM/SPASM domain-containing protein n=1 Tax=Methylocystis sp. H62 TaxID=2785789 RepID=UPI001FEF9757|nr:radical SAM protein [Methylocystis sp. H62]